MVIYTDGSRKDKRTGYGFYIERTNTRISGTLHSGTTVFQAEVAAIAMAVDHCISNNLKKVTICTDSRAAIGALTNSVHRSALTAMCRSRLDTLGQGTNVSLMWVPGHTGIKGNEVADELAKRGTEANAEVSLEVGSPYASSIQAINDWVTGCFEERWRGSEARQARTLIGSGLWPEFASRVNSMSRKQLRNITGILTGHCRNRKYLKDIKVCNSSECRWCLDEEETTEHILLECQALASLRRKCLGAAWLNPEMIRMLSTAGLATLAERLDL